jgi:hypothetical protein
MLFRNEILAVVSLLSATSSYSAFAYASVNPKGSGEHATARRQLKRAKNSKSTSKPCGPCETRPECFLVVPEDAFGTAVDPTGYKAVARADVIMDAPESSQIYICNASQEWVLKDVEAFLYNDVEDLVGFHFFNSLGATSEFDSGSPRWQVEESLVTGANPLSIDSPDGLENIRWLFVEIALNNEEGVLKDAQRIGRYCTKDGIAPVTTCETGDVFRSRYETAYYYFEKEE